MREKLNLSDEIVTKETIIMVITEAINALRKIPEIPVFTIVIK